LQSITFSSKGTAYFEYGYKNSTNYDIYTVESTPTTRSITTPAQLPVTSIVYSDIIKQIASGEAEELITSDLSNIIYLRI
jgi:hypothetical protein